MWISSKVYDFIIRRLEQAETERDNALKMLNGQIRVIEGRCDALSDTVAGLQVREPVQQQTQQDIVPRTWFDDMEQQIREMNGEAGNSGKDGVDS